MSKLVFLEQSYDDEDFDKDSTDTEEYLDSLADLNDFMDCPSTVSWQTEKQKAIESLIENCCDTTSFRGLCFSRGGLLNDDLRKNVWPLIARDNKMFIDRISSEEIKHHQYYNQVVMDVKRILKRFPPGINENIQADLQVKVTELIIRVLIANEGLHYYQGFHDIAITLLLVLGEEKSYSVLCRLSQSHFQLFMGPDMEPTMEILNLVYALVKNENRDLYNYLMRSELGTIFCLPWAITWFGHVLNDYETVVRLFDVFMFSHPWTSMYLSAVVVLHRASDIFLTPCEMPLLHQMLSNVPDNLPFDSLITETEKLMRTYPPDVMETVVREMHAENIRKIKEEDEERKRRMEQRKAALQGKHKKAAIQRWTPWPGFRNLRSQTAKVVALSVSVATFAFIYNYVRPNIEIF
ncbi:TBC1 domain family member 20-like isoform X2 [Daphnia pulicaria]|uniref:TBC1 domain family member 20-like isoform X2 n=1 Tax=Daphnia pulicaria TaxID=35523 RepID=UPI001EEC1C98|nr:TBC1 domain family member 20-like isoform X2 [Daphnia pulicaria]